MTLSACCRLIILATIGLLSIVPSAPSVTAKQSPHSVAVRSSPADAMGSARTIFIRTKSRRFKPAALEQELINRDEIQQWNLAISRDEADADLIIEVDRKLLTNIFVYNVLDPRTNRVVAGGKIGSLGGSVERQIADSFVKRMRQVR